MKKKLLSLTLLSIVLLMSSGLMFASATPTGNEIGANANDCEPDRDRDRDQLCDDDCEPDRDRDRNCTCDGDGESECNCNGPSDGGDGVRNCYGQTGDNDPKLEKVRSRIQWQNHWRWVN